MGELERQISATLLPGMYIPEPLKLLFRWIEEHGSAGEGADGKWIGYLYEGDKPFNPDEFEWVGTDISFCADGNTDLHYWLGHENPEVLNRLYVFAQTGADGSMAAFWLSPEGKQKIVHLGSGSGSALVCVLAEDAVDFLRLLAIGYDELCWSENYPYTFEEFAADYDGIIRPNVVYQKWVQETFGVEIPKTGLEIVKHPYQMHDTNPEDEFALWLAKYEA